MAKAKPITSPKKLAQLREKHLRVDQYAHDHQDLGREGTYQFAKKQGLSVEEVAKATSRNWSTGGNFLNPHDWLSEEEQAAFDAQFSPSEASLASA